MSQIDLKSLSKEERRKLAKELLDIGIEESKAEREAQLKDTVEKYQDKYFIKDNNIYHIKKIKGYNSAEVGCISKKVDTFGEDEGYLVQTDYYLVGLFKDLYSLKGDTLVKKSILDGYKEISRDEALKHLDDLYLVFRNNF